jgi:Xaa-Pro aminopeptidase
LKHIFEKRIDGVRKKLHKMNLDSLLVMVEENRYYLSGFTGEDTQYDESAGALIISQDQLLLATDSRYDVQAETQAPLFDIICYKKGLAKELPSIVKKLNIKKLGFESVRVSFQQYQAMKKELKQEGLNVVLVPTENGVESLRTIKDASEIEALRDALMMAESVFLEFIPTMQAGMTEKQVAWEMEKRMREKGADSLSFPVIVASGPNSALPHAIPGNRKIAEKEPILFDWGVRLNGYCSDISRTVILGDLDSTFKSVFQTVLDAQQKAIAMMKPGMTGKEVDQIARSYIDHTDFKDKFCHGLGHGTGLAVHESPRLSPIRDDLLTENMVFTVEPGIYLPGWGGVRLENMVVLRKDGAEVLNRTDSGDYRFS